MLLSTTVCTRGTVRPRTQPLFPTKAKNSSRVCLFSRNAPSIALVTACPCCFSTPRICMHKCRASTITPTPCGAIFSSIALAIWLVIRTGQEFQRFLVTLRRLLQTFPLRILSYQRDHFTHQRRHGLGLRFFFV